MLANEADMGEHRTLVAGGIYDQPARMWAAIRIARAEFGALAKKDREREERKRKSGRHGHR